MTDFVESFTTQQLIPPWISKGSRVWAFVVKTEAVCMQNYLDTHFNSPGPDLSPYYYRAKDSTGYGLLMVTDHCDFSSGHLGVENWDRVRHKEVLWSFPANRHPVGPDNLLGRPDPVWIQPFYFDDSSYVMFSSREIWGSEKQMGRITMQEGSHPGVLHIDLATQGFDVFSPRTKARDLAVLHVRMDQASDPKAVWEYILSDPHLSGFFGSMLGSVPQFAAGLSGKVNLEHKPSSVEINTLKQFRDVFDMRAAAYRAIIASKVTHNKVSDSKVYLGKNIELDFMWSATMAEQLSQLFGIEEPEGAKIQLGHAGDGPPPGDIDADWNLPRIPVTVEFAVSFTADSVFDVMGTLHTYGAPGSKAPI